MQGSVSLPRTKCAGSIPGGPSSGGRLPAAERGSDDIMPGWAPAALTQESPGGTRRARLQRQRPGSAPCTHRLEGQRLAPNNGHLWSQLFQQYEDSEAILQRRNQREGGKKTSAQWPFHSNKKGFQEVQSVSKLYPKATEINRGPLHLYQRTLEEAIT